MKSVQNTQEPGQNTIQIAFQKQELQLSFYKGYSNVESQIHSALFSGLLLFDEENLTVKSALAVSWFVNEDKLSYTFHLRENAKFSDGSQIRAQDVRDSWLAALENNSAFSYLFEPISGVKEYREGSGSLEDIAIHVLSDQTLRVDLEGANNEFLKIITHSVFSVTKSAQTKISDWERRPYTIPFSGPYAITDQSKNSLTLTKNPYHWASEFVSTDNIIVRFYDDEEYDKLAQKIIVGDVHWSSIYVDDAGIDIDWLFINQIFGTNYLFFRTAVAPWDKENIRTAVRLLIPFDTIREELYRFPASSLVPSSFGEYKSPEISYKQNSQMALDLLEEEGYPRGKGLPNLVLFVPSYNDEYSELFDAIKKSIEASSDIQVDIKSVPSDKYYDALATEEFVIASYSWIGDYVSPAAFLQMWISPSQELGHSYNNKAYRDLFSRSVAIEEEEKRNKALKEAEKILLDSSVVIPLNFLFAINIVRSDLIDGWQNNVLDHHQFARLKKKKSKLIPFITRLSHEQDDSDNSQ